MNKRIPFNKSFICPHCGTKAQFNLIFPDLNNEKSEDVEHKKASYDLDSYTSYSYTIWRCQVCEKLLFRAVEVPNYGQSRVVGQFPSSIRVDTDFRGNVPEEILEDFESALKCFEFDEYRPSAAMCRRSLQASLLEQGASPDKDLFDQIDDLNRTKPDRFTNDIKDWAHNIRIFGNWGSHPDKDGLKDVDQEIAREVIDFMKSYFHYVYVMPQKVATARSKQETKKPQLEE
jgi:hypothetical protein